jgi:hypothetical protein
VVSQQRKKREVNLYTKKEITNKQTELKHCAAALPMTPCVRVCDDSFRFFSFDFCFEMRSNETYNRHLRSREVAEEEEEERGRKKWRRW